MDEQPKADYSQDTWKKIVELYPEANFLQSPAYGQMNELLGDKALFLDFDGKVTLSQLSEMLNVGDI